MPLYNMLVDFIKWFYVDNAPMTYIIAVIVMMITMVQVKRDDRRNAKWWLDS